MALRSWQKLWFLRNSLDQAFHLLLHGASCHSFIQIWLNEIFQIQIDLQQHLLIIVYIFQIDNLFKNDSFQSVKFKQTFQKLSIFYLIRAIHLIFESILNQNIQKLYNFRIAKNKWLMNNQKMEDDIYFCISDQLCLYVMHLGWARLIFLQSVSISCSFYIVFYLLFVNYNQYLSKFMSQFQQQDLKNFKTIIIGRSAVGKSTLLLRYVEGQYSPQKPTIGIDYRFKKVSFQGTTFNLQLWDSAGQQRYRTIVYNYFNLSKAAVIVFDITSEQSLNDAKMWLQQLVLHCGNEIPKILLGNKCDLLDAEKLQEQIQKFKPTIDQLKQQYHCRFFTVSAYDGTNVEQAFNYLIKQLFDKGKFKIQDENVPKRKQVFKLDSKSQIKAKQNNKKNCC